MLTKPDVLDIAEDSKVMSVETTILRRSSNHCLQCQGDFRHSIRQQHNNFKKSFGLKWKIPVGLKADFMFLGVTVTSNACSTLKKQRLNRSKHKKKLIKMSQCYLQT